MQIKDVCKNHPSGHYMLMPGTIKKIGIYIYINGSTIKAYTQANQQEIHSFITCVLPKYLRHEAPIIKSWIIKKGINNRAVKYEEIYLLS